MRRVLAALAAGLALSACATSHPAKPVAHAPARHPAPPSASRPPPLTTARPDPLLIPAAPTQPGVSLARLPGWADEDHVAGLEAFRAGCGAARDATLRQVCARARSLGRLEEARAKAFLEANFEAQPVGEGGVLTAYFAPEYEARSQPDREFSAPVRPRPGAPVELRSAPVASPDLGDVIEVALEGGEITIEPEAPREAARSTRVDLARADRATIERASADGALAWMRPEDLFFLQIQGSGVLSFPGGRRMKATYASDNGRPFVAIARPMVQRGIFEPNRASGESIRGWLAANRGPKADAVMQLNPRYIFFDLFADDGREPAGAAGVPLPAGRAIAIDPSRHAYGDLYWIDAQAPILAGAHPVYRRLAMALDTGSAIRGEIRADLYIGRGPKAGSEAGQVRHTLKMVRLKPIETVRSAQHETDPQARGG